MKTLLISPSHWGTIPVTLELVFQRIWSYFYFILFFLSSWLWKRRGYQDLWKEKINFFSHLEENSGEIWNSAFLIHDGDEDKTFEDSQDGSDLGEGGFGGQSCPCRADPHCACAVEWKWCPVLLVVCPHLAGKCWELWWKIIPLNSFLKPYCPPGKKKPSPK